MRVPSYSRVVLNNGRVSVAMSEEYGIVTLLEGDKVITHQITEVVDSEEIPLRCLFNYNNKLEGYNRKYIRLSKEKAEEYLKKYLGSDKVEIETWK